MNKAALQINGQEVSALIPRRFAVDLNLVLLGIGPDGQQMGATWSSFLQQIRATHPHIDVYGLHHDRPVKGRLLSLGLLTLPRKLLGGRQSQPFTVALLTRQGEILWQSHATYSAEAGGELCAVIVDAYLLFHARIAPKQPALRPTPVFAN